MSKEQIHPIDQEIRVWLRTHVENHRQLSMASGHSSSWLHKYINGQGHATIDDLIRLAGLLMGLNLPAIGALEQKLLKACAGMDESSLLDVVAYAEHRARLARRGPSRESSEPTVQNQPAKVNRARGKRRDGGATT
jgi:hypothetical protein